MPTASNCPAPQRRTSATKARIDFGAINAIALAQLPHLLACWLPDGRREGREYVALNPRRHDRSLGSFRINVTTGRWADFAVGVKGGDVISLVSYLYQLPLREAAEELASRVGLGRTGGAHE